MPVKARDIEPSSQLVSFLPWCSKWPVRKNASFAASELCHIVISLETE